jgi:hypothetical protein
MRSIITYGTAALVGAVLLVAIVYGYLPRSATASDANNTMDVLKLEGTIDTKALPQQAIPPEAYQ